MIKHSDMMRNRLICLGIFLVIMGVVAGCPDDNPTRPQQVDKREIPIFEPRRIDLPSPMANSKNMNALLTMAYVKKADIYFDFMPYFIVPDSSDSLDWQLFWVVDSVTVTMNVVEDNISYHWTVVLDGTSHCRGVIYDDFIFMEMARKKDNTAGWCTIYDIWTNSADLLAEACWQTLSTGAVSHQVTFYNDGRKVAQIVIVCNWDHSGSLHYYEYEDETTLDLKFKAQWYFDSTGECWVYDESGVEIFHGYW